jgi:hypothetical protein
VLTGRLLESGGKQEGSEGVPSDRKPADEKDKKTPMKIRDRQNEDEMVHYDGI